MSTITTQPGPDCPCGACVLKRLQAELERLKRA